MNQLLQFVERPVYRGQHFGRLQMPVNRGSRRLRGANAHGLCRAMAASRGELSRLSSAGCYADCQKRDNPRCASHGSMLSLLSIASDPRAPAPAALRSEEHTSELQSPCNLVCRLLLE